MHTAYDSRGNLSKVTREDGRVRTYHYEDAALPHALTGVTDESGQRVGTYAYDAATGQALSTRKPDGSQFFGLSTADDSATVTDAAGHSETLLFTRSPEANRLTSRTDGTDGKALSQSFDARNNLVSATDEEGRTTAYA